MAFVPDSKSFVVFISVFAHVQACAPCALVFLIVHTEIGLELEPRQIAQSS